MRLPLQQLQPLPLMEAPAAAATPRCERRAEMHHDAVLLSIGVEQVAMTASCRVLPPLLQQRLPLPLPLQPQGQADAHGAAAARRKKA